MPPGRHYTEQLPVQTTSDLFRAGGTEAFYPHWHLSSTLYSAGRAFGQVFNDGGQYDGAVSFEARARFVRLIQLTA